MTSNSIVDYMVPLCQILVSLIGYGTLARCIYIIMDSMSNGEEINKVIQRVKKKVIAGIMAICIGQLLSVIANIYGYHELIL